MKVLLLLLAFVCVSIGYPVVRTWTFMELLRISGKMNFSVPVNPDDDPFLKAFNTMMHSIFTSKPEYLALLLSPTREKLWTKTQLEDALNDPKTNYDYMYYLVGAYNALEKYNANTANKGKEKNATEVVINALDSSTWTRQDITNAIKNPNVNPGLIPFLAKAQQELDKFGILKTKAIIITPVGLIPLPEGVQPVIVPQGPISDSKKEV